MAGKRITDLHADIGRRAAYKIPPKLINIPDDWNVRKTFDQASIDSLAKSIAEIGVKVPLIVRREGDKIFLVDGERRLRAIRVAVKKYKAQIKAVPVEFEAYGNEDDALVVNIVANEHREDVSPLEKAKGYKRLIDGEYEAKEIAGMLGTSTEQVTRTLRLLDAAPKVRAALKRGDVAPSVVSELVRRFPEDKEGQEKALADAIVSGGGGRATGENVRKAATKAKGKSPAARRRTRKVGVLSADLDVIDSEKVGSYPDGDFLDGFTAGVKYAASMTARPSWLPKVKKDPAKKPKK